MRITGVISEFNPFHFGHEYLLSELRARGAGIIVCAMSGDFVQRGEAALADKYSRAAMAVSCGADIVVELPYPYSAAGAESFAAAGVSILGRMGVDTLGFGSELGELGPLFDCAEVMLRGDFAAAYRRRCREGQGGAAAYAAALAEAGGSRLPGGSNDILAIEYIKAARRAGFPLSFEAVKRAGGAHDRGEASGGFLSARAIRERIFSSGIDASAKWMPPAAYTELARASDAGCAPASLKHLGAGLIAMLRLSGGDSGRDIAECGDGLAARLRRAAGEAGDLEELFALASAKNYTDARLRRALLFYLTGVLCGDIKRDPAFTLLLAANRRGVGYLAARRRVPGIRVISKPADARALGGEASRQDTLARLADALWTMTLPAPAGAGLLLRRRPVLL